MRQDTTLTVREPEVPHLCVIIEGHLVSISQMHFIEVLIVRFGAVLLEILRQFYRLLIGHVASIVTTNNTTKVKTNKALNTVRKPPPFDCVLYVIRQLVYLLQNLTQHVDCSVIVVDLHLYSLYLLIN
jgi:uncharacterized membrane protein